MKKIYFLSNNLISRNCFVLPQKFNYNDLRMMSLLSNKGLDKSMALAKKFFTNIDAIFSSLYFCAMESSRIIAEENDLDVEVDELLNERLVGELNGNEFRYLKGMQEHDFDYKLNNGESINEVKLRMTNFLNKILKDPAKNIVVVTHNTALISLCLNWCTPDYNLDDRLLLTFNDDVIFDGVYHDIDLIEMTFNNQKLLEIRRVM